MLETVINCLRLFVVVIYCYHGDGSDGRHVCTKYYGHTYYYQAAMLETVFYSLRLFVVGGEHIAMAMVVVGHICTQNMTVIHNISTSYRLIN